jgi:hypothetical protein
MPTPTRSSTVLELQKLLDGVQKNLSTASLVLDGVAYDGAQLEALVEQALASAIAIREAHTGLTDAILADETLQVVIGPKVRGLRDVVRVMYASQITTLAEFGLEPRKTRAPMTVEAKLLRAERVRATRKARNTMGAKQKRAIKGNVTGVTITPVTTGAPEAGSGGTTGKTPLE